MNEPITYNLFKKEVRSWFGILTLKNDEKNGEKAIKNSLTIGMMNEQLSVDLIYTILYSITENIVGTKKSERWLDYIKYDFKNKNQTVIEFLMVKNANLYNINN